MKRLQAAAKPLQAADVPAALLSTVVSLAVYVYTLAPTVTFKDSGELIVAALHWGVPHPTGYPLWTALAGLFSLLPLGSGAWEINLFSAVCAALATGLTAALMANMGRRLGAERRPATLIATGVSLVFAFSVAVWSQSVFAEVYTVHILVAAVFWWALFRWYLEPENLNGFLLCVFVLALGMTNHHLMLALAPLPLLVAFLRRREVALELFAWSATAGAVFYLAFASIADHQGAWETAIRTGQLMLLMLVAFLLLRGRLRHWRVGLAIIPVIALGLLPYVYMPLASSTNPPMNWGYTRTADGFYYSVNRSPYRGPLSDQLEGTLGRLVGTKEESPVDSQPVQQTASTEAENIGLNRSKPRLLWDFAMRYLAETARGFTWWTWPLIALALWRFGAERRWLVVVGAGFGLSAFFQPASAAAAGAGARLEWLLQMPYLGYSYIPLALLLGYGLHAAYRLARRYSPFAGTLVVVVALLMPLFGLTRNWEECSQRGRWFAWEFGHDMLAPLPEGAVLFGGSDAGRFIPTYMIFGESVEQSRHKRDPDFDRRDIYLITQTQLIARFYRSYIRDHYSAERPEPGPLGKLLGRQDAYPDKPLTLPSENDIADLLVGIGERRGSISELASDIAYWIYLANKDEHEFFVEDSIDMPWTRPLAIPAGPVYRLAKEPRRELTDEEIATDFAYWDRRIEELLAEPRFLSDIDARMAIMALRYQSARIYRDRGLTADAEDAYRQAIEIMPNELKSMLGLGNLLAGQGRWFEAREIFAQYTDDAPLIAELDRQWLVQQEISDNTSRLYTQLVLDPLDQRMIRDVLLMRTGSGDTDEQGRVDSQRVFDLVDDLKLLERDGGNTVALRRVLGLLRDEETHGLADYISHKRLQVPSLRLVQLLVADQRMQPTRLTDDGRALRLALAKVLLGLGEAELALDAVQGQRRDDEMLAIRDEARRLRTTQEELDPVLDRWRTQTGLVQRQVTEGDSFAARLNTLGRALAIHEQAPSGRSLAVVVATARQLRLPRRAREVLLELNESGAHSTELLVVGARLASRDVLPHQFLPLADKLEALQSPATEVALTVATLRFAANDQEGLQRAIGVLLGQVGREGVVALFDREPLLAPLVSDPRFRRFLFGVPLTPSPAPPAEASS
ncbi:MAG: DUF2723 domain-containing protein [Acidobacteriota bacterium]